MFDRYGKAIFFKAGPKNGLHQITVKREDIKKEALKTKQEK